MSLFADMNTLFTQEELIREIAKFLVNIHGRRFPKKSNGKNASVNPNGNGPAVQ